MKGCAPVVTPLLVRAALPARPRLSERQRGGWVDLLICSMKKEITMKNAMLFALAACFAWPAFGAETGEIVEIFGCNLKDGKSMADFDTTVSAWQKDMDKNEGVKKNDFAAVMVPYRAKSQYDVVWVGSNPNLTDWAKGAAIHYTAVGRTAQARFDSVSDVRRGTLLRLDVVRSARGGKTRRSAGGRRVLRMRHQ